MVLVFVGLGLLDERDITIRGKDEVDKADFIYLESYTSILRIDKTKLEGFYGLPVIEADRSSVEECDEMLERAKHHRVVLLVVGDPFCATTHADLFLRAKGMEIETIVVHNASVLNAVGACGLQLYRFGETVSIPYFEPNWMPESIYDKIQNNLKNGLHTLCLLDIKVKEQTVENLCKGREIFEPSRFMSVCEAISQLLALENVRQEQVLSPSTRAFGVARLGANDQLIASGSLEELRKVDFGEPLHSLVICASNLHEVELSFFRLYNCDKCQHAQ